MQLKSKEIIDLILASKKEKCDCFLVSDHSPTAFELCDWAGGYKLNFAVALPGRGVVPDFLGQKYKNDRIRFYPSSVFSDLSFWESEKADWIDELVVLNAELADRNEYGFLRDWTRVGEIRAGLQKRIHLVATFNCDFDNTEADFLSLLGSKNAIKVGSCEPLFTSEIYSSPRAKFNGLENHLGSSLNNIIVFCTTRREAQELSRRLNRDGLRNMLFHGGLDDKEKAEFLKNTEDRVRIPIVATKSLLEYAIFIPDVDVVYYGIPYSIAHASRLASFSQSVVPKLKCFYCVEDVEMSVKLSNSYAEQFAEDSAELKQKRNKDLLDMVKKLI